ncbi:MAG: glucosaminidase domain-containing protein [Bacteroidales bacterium]|nr:glucosaminidase domain-containing protein [Bacteroidales bacterium]
MHGIPASITLAQGLLESQCGESRLAKVGNNHFGIKCNGWTGDTILKDDDKINDCFRRYARAEDSFSDHSAFLKRKRYAPLFNLKKDDYAAWARTLKKCGYATDPAYPDKLIRLIETYQLYKYDKNETPLFADNSKSKNKVDTKYTDENITINDEQLATEIGNAHVIRRRWGLYYIVAHEGDTFASLAKELNVKEKNLAKFNDLHKDDAIAPGETIWIEQKEKEAAMGNNQYTAKQGDTLHSISQYYGIRLKNLAKMNKLKENSIITPGTVIILR